ncbi:aromatic ring-hydroxylating dioxygenase subunit alpha [Lyngbya confervoides]|uniref:Aromatic ring-hydroxylating dioxygenase subunit alpha n=1 Tax=Lyngbya confervoides BDU141951 TaxID=1574623 RepID=A0ABD4SYT9_9CYAN|nr:aromatic ring-hydroxylating dioxygenase subunit alpha [Lyngbya confervoides]MCM1981443.1 aromatic ring-hydroxylating dioxygenase subunit alpha [Lyngbya confervoides BDU141951]
MELATKLIPQTVRNSVREAGPNLNHWYAVGWAKDFGLETVQPVTIWNQSIAVFRDSQGQFQALENACPHRGVELHRGRVKGCHLVCPYHGWEFNSQGACVQIPYLPSDQKLPPQRARSFPIQERYGIVWIFPGETELADQIPLLSIPEFGQPGLLMIPITGHFQAHFSICNENTMDVFHGFLHEDLQGWFDPVLLTLEETENAVLARYSVSYRGKMAKFLGLAEDARETTTLPITIEYHYPNYATSLEGISSLYLMRLPVGPQESRSFALFFFRVRLPQWLIQRLQPILVPLLRRFFLEKFLAQDRSMMESEQHNYDLNPQRHYAEINPAIIAIQRMTLRQYDRYLQKKAPAS